MSQPPDEKFTRETIASIRTWVPGKLFSFTCTRPTGFRFSAGQFARLGIPNTLGFEQEPELIWRAYSMVSSPYDEHLEFFSIVVPQGAFTSHLCQLQVGDTVLVDKTNFGFLTTARFESGADLWLLASGTGLAPFLSILADHQTWEQFKHVVLVHSARTVDELVYQDWIAQLPQMPVIQALVPDCAQRFTYLPVVTRDPQWSGLQQRIPSLLESGQLAQAAQRGISKTESRFMICGNPDMVTDTRNALKALGFLPARRNAPGEVAVENYW